jgi:hypothetical protein
VCCVVYFLFLSPRCLQVGVQALLCHSYRGYGPGITSVSPLMAAWATADGSAGVAAVGSRSRAGLGWSAADAAAHAAAALAFAATQLGLAADAFAAPGGAVEALHGGSWFAATVVAVLPHGRGLRVIGPRSTRVGARRAEKGVESIYGDGLSVAFRRQCAAPHNPQFVCFKNQAALSTSLWRSFTASLGLSILHV